MVGAISGLKAPVFGTVFFGRRPGDEGHGWWPEDFTEVDWLFGIEDWDISHIGAEGQGKEEEEYEGLHREEEMKQLNT